MHGLLKKSEKIFKTDMVYLVSGSFWLGIGQVIGTLSGFLLSIALANLLTKDAYGTYRLALSIAGLFSIFTLSGISDSLIRSIARGSDGTLVPATKARMKGGAIGACVSLIMSAYYFFIGHNETLTLIYLIVACFLPFFDTFSNFGSYLQGKKDFKTNTYYGILVHVGAIAIMLVVLFATRDFIWVLLAYFVAYTALRLLCFWLVLRKIEKSSHVDKDSVRYGGHLTAINVLGTIASQLDRILLFHFLGAVPVALYSIAIAAPDQVKQGMSILDKLVYPRFSSHSENSIRDNIGQKMLLFGIGSAVVVGIYILLAPWFYEIFFKQYTSIVWLSQLYSISMMNTALTPTIMFFEAHRKLKEQYWLNVASSIFQISTMLLGIIFFGLLGLIVARILTRFFGGFFALYLYLHPLTPKTDI